MNSLQSELDRLYFTDPAGPVDANANADAQSSTSIDASATVRAMVLELTRPPTWKTLSKVWHGVQTELGLPAPAIAVSGVDGLQLWFSLQQPVAPAQAHAFLVGLRSKFLADIEPDRVRLIPDVDGSAGAAPRILRRVPARQAQTENWSAFVAPDLAPIFAETPWLDIQPSEEGQAALLASLRSMNPSEFEAASKRLGPDTAGPRASTAGPHPTTARPSTMTAGGDDPRRFLIEVMNDGTVALALRIEAAKVLLQHSTDQRP